MLARSCFPARIMSRREAWLTAIIVAATPLHASANEDTPRTSAPGVGPGPPISKVVDLNTATAEELDSLPGVGRKRAEAIVAKRPFRRVTELLRVKGFGPKLFAKVRPLIVVSVTAAASGAPAPP
jgi:competence ComEA-like helix-hairpin-helix protein